MSAPGQPLARRDPPAQDRIKSRAFALIVLLWLAGAARALALLVHTPLYAYANSYDEVRYSACYGLFPDRPASVPPAQNSPQAPYARYRFVRDTGPGCYWSSEFLFGGTVAALYALDRALTGAEAFPVRWLGALRLAVLLALSAAFSLAWLRRGQVRAAAANAVLLPVLFADPGNTLYFNTFYAEWTALLAACALFGAILFWRDQARTRGRFMVLALLAFLLAASKLQHLLSPLALALVVLVIGRLRKHRVTWQAAALLLGALAGLYFQFVQLQRGGEMMETMRQYNAADVVFTALVPLGADPQAVLGQLNIDPRCAAYRGERAWQMPDLPVRACPGLVNFSRGGELKVLLSHPRLALRLAWRGVLGLDPWVARNIGQVENATFDRIPAWQSLGSALDASRALFLAVLAVPLLALGWLGWRRGIRDGGPAFDYAALTATLMLTTLAVTVLGDGLADTAKQGHLVVNAALAFLIAGVVGGGLPRRLDWAKAPDPHVGGDVDLA